MSGEPDRRPVIARATDFRPPVGQHVSPTVKIAKRQGQEQELMGDAATVSKFTGEKLDERRTQAARAKLAEIRRGKLEELASVMDYLTRRAFEDPHDHEARELAVRSMLANHISLSSERITRLLAPVERGIAQMARAGGEAAAHALRQHGFRDVTPKGLLRPSLDDNAMHKLAPKFAEIERGWIKVADHREVHDTTAAELDTAGGFAGGPEMSEVVVFRAPEGHVARVIDAALIAGEAYVLAADYLAREGF